MKNETIQIERSDNKEDNDIKLTLKKVDFIRSRDKYHLNSILSNTRRFSRAIIKYNDMPQTELQHKTRNIPSKIAELLYGNHSRSNSEIKAPVSLHNKSNAANRTYDSNPRMLTLNRNLSNLEYNNKPQFQNKLISATNSENLNSANYTSKIQK